MNTDKNKLLMAMGEIDDKFINEVLTEDLTGVRKKKSPVVRYMKYYLPAAAALLFAIVCIRSSMRLSSDTAANAVPASYEAADYAAQSDSTAVYEDAECMVEDKDTDRDYTLGLSEIITNNSSTTASQGSYAYEATPSEAADESISDNADGVGIANPFVSFDSLEDAKGYTGIELSIPEEYSERYETDITAVRDMMVQVIFFEDDAEVFRIRKGYEDVSGDYNTYAYERSFEDNGFSGKIKGNDASDIRNAVWQSDGSRYSFSAGDTVFSEDEVMEIISEIMSSND